MTTWQVQAAKQRLSEVLRAAESGEPQFITRHGETIAVVVDIEDYRRSHEPEKPSLLEFLLDGERIDGLEDALPARVPEPDRPLGWEAEPA
jgi:prevent-host-death family protein